MALKDIVVNIILQLSAQARAAFVSQTQAAINQATNPKAAQANLNQLQGSVNNLGAAIQRVGSWFRIAFGGKLVADFIKGSIEAFLEFDKTLNQSIAIMDNVSSVMRDKLGATSIELSKELNISAIEINKAFYELASAGLDSNQVIKAIPVVAAFAKAGLIDTAKASLDLTTALTSMGYRSKDAQENMDGMARVANVLAMASTMSQGKIEDLTLALNNKTAPAFRLLGKDVEEAVAALAVLADQGRRGTVAGERLSIFMRNLSQAALTHKAAWKAMGVEVYDSSGKMNKLSDIVRQLSSYLENLSPRAQNIALIQSGLQQRSLDAAKSFIGQADALKQYEDALSHADGYVEKLANKNLASMSERLGQVQQKITAARIEIGQAFVPALEGAGAILGDENDPDGLIAQLHNFAYWIGENHEMISGFITGGLRVLITTFEAVFTAFNVIADVIVGFITSAIYPLALGLEIVIRGFEILASTAGMIAKVLGLDFAAEFFDGFSKKVDEFGNTVGKFRQHMGEAAELAYDDFNKPAPNSPPVVASKNLVHEAFKTKGKGKQNAGTTGHNNEGDVPDKDAKKKQQREHELDSLNQQLASLGASLSETKEDNITVRLDSLEKRFHEIFGQSLPKSIQDTIDQIRKLAGDTDKVQTVLAAWKAFKDLDKAHSYDNGESFIQGYLDNIDKMEALLPTLDKNSKAYHDLQLAIEEARKELHKYHEGLAQHTNDIEQENRRLWKEHVDAVGNYFYNVTTEIEGMWERVFTKLFTSAHKTRDIFKEVFKSITGIMLGGLGDFAMKKAKENSLLAGEEFVKGLAAAADPLRAAEAPGHFLAAAKFEGQAALWAAAAGGTGALAGLGGSTSSGASDIGGSSAKDANPKQGDINIYIDGVDPNNPRHQQLIGDTAREYMERTGSSVFINPRRP